MAKSVTAVADHWLKLLICSVFALNAQLVFGDSFLNLTFLESAVSKGAVCLDGSPPAYAFDKGFGDGANNWVVFLEGGGWCNSKSDCLDRAQGYFGNSISRPFNRTFFSGILDQTQIFNPDFYNWNKVFVLYCDGASFMADVERVDPKTNLTYRGARIFDAVMDEMLAKGMKNAENAILTGTSAGGLATMLHCDKFRGLIPNAGRVKCISDSGFFIHGTNLPGAEYRLRRFAKVVKTHKLAKLLPTSCTSKMDEGLCFFPENFVRDIQTPLFILESAFEKFQIEENLIPCVGGKPKWSNCTSNLTLCSSTQLQTMKDFRSAFIETLEKVVDKSSNRGLYVHSCYRHGHFNGRDGWMCSSLVGNYALGNKTIGKAISDWYFDRSPFQQIDLKNELPFNCTSTLTHQEFGKQCEARLNN
ncbi:hypothetical protein ACP275_01G049300 [Erythranthe tilingii]